MTCNEQSDKAGCFVQCMAFQTDGSISCTLPTLHKLDMLHVRLTELHAAHQNLPPAIHTLRLKETIKIYTKNDQNLTI